MSTFDPLNKYTREHGIPSAKDDLTREKHLAEQTGQSTRFEVTPYPTPIIGTRWEVTIGHQAHPIASTLTQMQAIEAARVATDVIGHRGNIWINERNGGYRDERTIPGHRYPFPWRG